MPSKNISVFRVCHKIGFTCRGSVLIRSLFGVISSYLARAVTLDNTFSKNQFYIFV